MNERRTPASDQAGASKGEAQSPPPGAGGRRLVLLGRILLLFIAALALVSAIALVRERDRDAGLAQQASAEHYVCPMHPEVTSRVPGECPICHMALERVSEIKETPPASLQNGAVGQAERRTVTQLVRAPAWIDTSGVVTAELHDDDLVGVSSGEQALFFGTATPGAETPVRFSSEPPVRWDPSTVLAHFRLQGPGDGRRDTGWVQLSPRPRDLLVVPASAVLYSGEGAYVLAAPPGGHTFTRRAVRVGRILDSGYAAGLVDARTGAITVLSGLQEGERVVVSDTFFLDAERRLQAARGGEAEVNK